MCSLKYQGEKFGLRPPFECPVCLQILERNGGGKGYNSTEKMSICPVVTCDLEQFQTKAANWKISSPLSSSLHCKNTSYKRLNEAFSWCFPRADVLLSLETISRAPAGTHLQTMKFWFYALFLPLCRGYFDVLYTAGLIQIIVR